MSSRATRRAAIQRAGFATAGLASAGILRPPRARASLTASETSVALVESAIGLEQRVALAYEAIASLELLEDEVSRAAELFAQQEREHADALVAAVEDLGGAAPEPPAPSDVEGLLGLESQPEALELALRLENELVVAYLDAAEVTSDTALLRTFAQILGCEAQHEVVLRQQLGVDPVPEAFEEGETAP